MSVGGRFDGVWRGAFFASSFLRSAGGFALVVEGLVSKGFAGGGGSECRPGLGVACAVLSAAFGSGRRTSTGPLRAAAPRAARLGSGAFFSWCSLTCAACAFWRSACWWLRSASRYCCRSRSYLARALSRWSCSPRTLACFSGSMPAVLRAEESTEVVWSTRDLRLSSSRTSGSRCFPESCANSRPSAFQCPTQPSRSFSTSKRFERSFSSFSWSRTRSTWSLGVPSRKRSVRTRSTAPWMASAASCQCRSSAARLSPFCSSVTRLSSCEASADACIIKRWRCSTS